MTLQSDLSTPPISPAALHPGKPDRSSESSATLAHARLRDAILSLDLRPGETLTETRLSEYLHTSRTTVRSALARLQNEGLVCKDGRSFIVAPIHIPEIQQAFEYREVLEVGALRLAFPRLTRADLERVREFIDDPGRTPPLDEYLHRATDFHLELARLSGNEFLVRALEDVLVRLSRARWLEASAREGRAQAHADHLHLLELLHQGQLDAACEHVQTHLRRSRDHLITALTHERRGLRLRGLAVVL